MSVLETVVCVVCVITFAVLAFAMLVSIISKTLIDLRQKAESNTDYYETRINKYK